MGLTREQLDIINATAPVVGEHALEITQTFYPRMFSENPEVFEYFNKANQSSGRQPRALADAVVAYALNIERLEALGSAVNRMVHKHVALQVPPEGYDIVGKHLMWAIHEVLGEAVTPAVHDAWVAAYTQLADILKGAEANLYKEQKEQVGGWEGYRSFRIANANRTSSGIMRLTLKPVDGKCVAKAIPGQYVSVHFDPKDVEGMEGETHLAPRHYSIVEADDNSITLCVRRVQGGVVSNHLHSHCEAGNVLQLSAPVGCFALEDSAPKESTAVFVAGGIGFTPLLSMAEAAAEKGHNIVWVHSITSPEDAAFCKPRAGKQVIINTSERSRLTAEELLDISKNLAAPHYYFCGPPAMIEDLGKGLLASGVARESLHYEMFGPHMQL